MIFMNYNTYPGSPLYTGNTVTPNQEYAPKVDIPFEQSYIENILRVNKGKLINIYMTFPDSVEWRDKVFTGILEQLGRDHIIISDPKTGKWQLLLMIYVSYITFEETINYPKL